MKFPLAIILFLSCFSGFSQATIPCIKVNQFKSLLDKHHVHSQSWDDEFSRQVFSQILYLTDPHAMYFDENDFNYYQAGAPAIMKDLISGNCSFLTEMAASYRRVLLRSDKFIEEISKSGVAFDRPDTMRYAFQGGTFAAQHELKQLWIRYIKFNVLKETARGKGDYPGALSKVCRKQRLLIKRKLEIEGGVENFLFNKLLNAIASVYDPHTQYFSVQEKNAFLEFLTEESFSFGIVLSNDALGNISIGRIVPGSSAWDSHMIHEGDAVIAINSPHMERVDAEIYSVDELNEIMESISNQMELSVRRVTGEEITVTLTKQKIHSDENKIKSVILSDIKYKFGYIHLPVFFSPDQITHSGCANELAKEIIQLKKSKIQGLVLDIRDNGGGDLQEAIDLVGIFVDRGAVAIVKARDEEPETLKDTNLGTVYDGPLVVMINGGSASASELFAAAMRDHNRGILVGTQTFGKGTGQTLMPFTGTDGDATKITSFQFYGVRGNSHQGVGVMPDIILPDVFSALDYHEHHQRFYVKSDFVNKKTYYTPLPPLPIDMLRDSSQHRVSKNPFFNNVMERSEQLSKYVRNKTLVVPLSKEGFDTMIAQWTDDREEDTPVTDRYTVGLTAFDQQVNVIDQFGTKTYEIFMDKISHDHYIVEALEILRNYSTLKK